MSQTSTPKDISENSWRLVGKGLVFGADGGGTKTLGVVADAKGRELARRTVGASNPNVVGFETAAANLFQLIKECCDEVKCSPQDLCSIVLGLAGGGREENRARLREMINSLAVAELPITIETDARIGLEGAFEGAPGIVVIAGTGSVVIGKKSSGEVVIVGGWGRGLSDEGSGFYLGLEALKSLRLYYDGRGGSRLLAEMIAKEFGLNSRQSIIAAVHQEKFEPSKVAPLVLQAAEQNDPTAHKILNSGADELADQAHALVKRLELSDDIRISFFGGLIEHENVYSNILKKQIKVKIRNAEVIPPARSSAEGAILMALEICKKT